MGVSINGFIARENGDSEWTSKEDLQGFFDNSRKVGNIIMGKNTFLEASKQGYFPFPDALNVVLTQKKFENKWGEQVKFLDRSPKEVLQILKEKGFKNVFLAGGGQVNASFLKEGLVDEIYLDIEPLALGKGVPVFAQGDFEADLELLEVNKLNQNTVQLHYKVKRVV